VTRSIDIDAWRYLRSSARVLTAMRVSCTIIAQPIARPATPIVPDKPTSAKLVNAPCPTEIVTIAPTSAISDTCRERAQRDVEQSECPQQEIRTDFETVQLTFSDRSRVSGRRTTGQLCRHDSGVVDYSCESVGRAETQNR
jgi:hypothetical protein